MINVKKILFKEGKNLIKDEVVDGVINFLADAFDGAFNIVVKYFI